MSPWITRRVQLGFYDQLMVELENENPAYFINFMRMEPAMFRELRDRLAPRITKQDTNFRPALEPGLKLACTLRYLATGEAYTSIRWQFRVPHNTLSLIVKEVCQAIIDEFAEEMVSTPRTPDQWKEVANKFGQRWNFHHTLGALDGKHIAIQKPAKSGSLYYNYKQFFSIILLALVDVDYRFLWVDCGSSGEASDCQVFNQNQLKRGIEDGNFGIL